MTPSLQWWNKAFKPAFEKVYGEMTETAAIIKYWIKIPGPGQIRGEGNWHLCTSDSAMQNYRYCKATGYMPTYEGEKSPREMEKESE